MGYELRAVIGDGAAIGRVAEGFDSATIALEHGLFLIPWTDELFDSLGSDAEDVTGGLRYLHSGLVQALTDACELSPLVYVEADFFGGVGEQGAAVFRDGQLEWSTATGPVNFRLNSRTPISQALHMIGAPVTASKDEFDTIGLGQHRHLDDWTRYVATCSISPTHNHHSRTDCLGRQRPHCGRA